MAKWAFIRTIPDQYMSPAENGTDKLHIALPTQDHLSFDIRRDSVFQSTDRSGKDIPGYHNVRLGAPNDMVRVTANGPDGKPADRDVRASELSDTWKEIFPKLRPIEGIGIIVDPRPPEGIGIIVDPRPPEGIGIIMDPRPPEEIGIIVDPRPPEGIDIIKDPPRPEPVPVIYYNCLLYTSPSPRDS